MAIFCCEGKWENLQSTPFAKKSCTHFSAKARNLAKNIHLLAQGDSRGCLPPPAGGGGGGEGVGWGLGVCTALSFISSARQSLPSDFCCPFQISSFGIFENFISLHKLPKQTLQNNSYLDSIKNAPLYQTYQNKQPRTRRKMTMIMNDT